MKTDWNEERFSLLLRTKSYQELTRHEKEFVAEMVRSEEEYNELRTTELALMNSLMPKDSEIINPVILKSLKNHLRSSPAEKQWLHKAIAYRMPSYATAALVVFTFLFTWILLSEKESNVPAVTLTKIDTIFLSPARDTVFIERVVYRDRPLPPLTQNVADNVKLSESVKTINGISMKEKEELEALLVSGTD